MKKFLAFLVLFTATCSVPVATCSVPVALATGEKTPEFHMKLTVKGCQVGELHIGCKAGATVGYDKGQDIYVPPAAIQGGTIGLLIEGDPLPLYQNIRPAELPQTWRIRCRTQGRASISWDKDLLPEGVAFTIRKEGGQPFDMRKIDSMTIIKDTELFITASKQSVKIEE
jgi:hypothetical protein